ncbi:MAG: immunoglobulin domain-containing protein [Verrucomicrobiota bacterium]
MKTILWIMVIMAACSVLLYAQEFVWTQSGAPNKQWQFVTSSSDGTKLMAAVYGVTNEIWISSNGGVTWTKSAAPTVIQWSCGASSSDGSKLLAAVGDGINGSIYISTNSGLTWTQTSAPNKNWWSVASSYDGTKLVAGSGGSASGSGVFISTNSGLTWLPAITPTNGTYRVAASFDGTTLIAADLYGRIYTSTNSGLTWIQTSAPANSWKDVAISADGGKLVAIVFGGGIFTSTNSGLTWAQTSAPSTNWFRVATSSDGTKLAALHTAGIYTSTNSGLTWIQSSIPDGIAWSSVASTSDGTRLMAAVGTGGIYIGNIKTNPPQITQQPLNLAVCPGSSFVLKVTVTGTPPFVYQWRQGGTNLADGGNISGSTSPTLSLISVSENNATQYDVVVTNAMGSVTSSVAVVIVNAVPAKAIPVIVNGFVVGVTLTDGGCGYTNSPIVVFSGQGGSGASGYGQISGGSVTNIVITSAGLGYPFTTVAQVGPAFFPAVNIVLTNTPAAAATPVILNGFVVGANLNASGSDYKVAPSVTFRDISGQGAAAYTQISNGSVTNIVITSAGSSYSSNTVINIPPAAYRNAVIPNANSLMLGQSYQLEIAYDFGNWVNYGVSFFATNNTWTPSDYWGIANAKRMFFRLRLLP